MEESVSNGRGLKFLIIAGSALLDFMGIFHSTGILFISKVVNKSNAEDFIKEIFPVLFLVPSIHLFGLAAFAMATLFIKKGRRTILVITSILIALNMFAAFYLGAVIPGIVLLLSGTCLILAALRKL